MLRNLDITETIRRKMKLILTVLQLYILSSVLTLTCMNDLTGAKVLIGERILCNAVKDIYFTSKMKFEKLSNYSSVRKEEFKLKSFYYNMCGFSIAFSMNAVGYFDLKSIVTAWFRDRTFSKCFSVNAIVCVLFVIFVC
jgi:hypothetical protein